MNNTTMVQHPTKNSVALHTFLGVDASKLDNLDDIVGVEPRTNWNGEADERMLAYGVSAVGVAKLNVLAPRLHGD